MEGIDRILIDARGITTEIPTMARFEIGSHVVEQHPYRIMIALVGQRNAVWPDRFLETVMVNRAVQAKVTADFDEALNRLSG